MTSNLEPKISRSYEKRLIFGFFVGWFSCSQVSGRTFSGH